jgi:hypothetical protein
MLARDLRVSLNVWPQDIDMPTLHEEQPAFDRAVCDAMVASTPDTWNTILLTLERSKAATQLGEFEHSISSPDGLPPVMPDPSLYDATYKLDQLFQKHGAPFRRAIYRVELLPDSWKYTAEFEYDPSVRKKGRSGRANG